MTEQPDESPKYPATYTVHCPSGPENACEEHARQLRGLYKFMGCHVGITKAPLGAECGNCKNKADK